MGCRADCAPVREGKALAQLEAQPNHVEQASGAASIFAVRIVVDLEGPARIQLIFENLADATLSGIELAEVKVAFEPRKPLMHMP